MDISIGLLDRENDPRESKMEATLFDDLAFQVTPSFPQNPVGCIG